MLISVIIPVYNEINYIEKCLKSIFDAIEEDSLNQYEVIISDGLSNDGTFELLQELNQKLNFQLYVNKDRKQVFALNQMINVTKGNYIVRCDAHSIYPIGYFSGLVEYLEKRPDVGNVGYRVRTVSTGDSLIENLISTALHSKFGVGSSHRTNKSSEEYECDTLLFGAWRKSIFDDVGLFDTNFIRGQDLEHNVRIIKSGLKVIQLPDKYFDYYGRNSISKLFKMMCQYSSVKPFIFKKHGIFPNLRSFVPLLFFVSLISSFLINPFLSLLLILLYFSFSTYYAFKALSFDFKKLKHVPILVVIFFIQHLGHSVGWFAGLVNLAKSKIDWKDTR